MFLVLDTVFGLPAHALVVHVAVILVPLSAVALAAVGWRAPWRHVYALPIAGLAVMGAVAAIFASGSGETLQSSVRSAARAAGANARFGEHPEQGEAARTFAFIFAVAAVALWVVDRWGARWNLPKWAPGAAYAVGAVLGLVATWSMMVAGHSGAALVWRDVGTYAASR